MLGNVVVECLVKPVVSRVGCSVSLSCGFRYAVSISIRGGWPVVPRCVGMHCGRVSGCHGVTRLCPEQLHTQVFPPPGAGCATAWSAAGLCAAGCGWHRRAIEWLLSARLGGREPTLVGFAQVLPMRGGGPQPQARLLLRVTRGAPEHAAVAVVSGLCCASQHFDHRIGNAA